MRLNNFNSHWQSIFIVVTLTVLGLIASGITIMKKVKDLSAPDVVSYYPFISVSDTIEYVRSSKLMVFANNEKGNLLDDISRIYGNASSCISSTEPSELIKQANYACESGQHIVAINVSYNNVSQLKVLEELAKEYNYLVTLTGESLDLFPTYVGWHLNEADSCMLGLVAHAYLEELLRSIPEFCSDFRNFSESETIPEMLKFYVLASSNYHGMLHCTAKYLGYDPTISSKSYFGDVRSNISQMYETSIIGLVFTPRTFGARVRLSPDQLELWGGDDDNDLKSNSSGSKGFFAPQLKKATLDPVLSICSDLAAQSISDSCDIPSKSAVQENNQVEQQLLPIKHSPRRFPHCQASLFCISGDDKPDFHPVRGRGHRAHMTLGVAPGVSAVTTGTDLLEIVKCESEGLDWPTYEGPRGWLRDYGEGRWVLYMKKKIQVGALFSGVYDFTSKSMD